ncbi:MAG: PhnA domain-containing protein [Desulfuromonadales bacterium]
MVVKVSWNQGENIRIIQGDHDIDCRIDGVGEMQLQSECVKKA